MDEQAELQLPEKKLLTFWIDKELMRQWRVKLAEREITNQSAWLADIIKNYLNS